MTKLSTTIGSVAVLGMLFGWGSYLPGAGVNAASGRVKAPGLAVQARGVAEQATAPLAQAFFAQYCVSCHNERRKIGGLTLDNIDNGDGDVSTHAATLERVVRKLRVGAMPPEGQRRPDTATLEAFVASLETALDRAAAAAPNPGRVASRRLNRTEYANAIYDLLGLEVNAAELLPSDMAGAGFDNNADVLAVTPALLARYLTAATKISRVALGSSDNRPTTHVFQVGFEDRYSRRSESMPFATHAGLAVSHAFPLDGEYEFQVRLKRDFTDTIQGIRAAEYELELRVDHALVKRFIFGGKDNANQGAHPDDALQLRVPVKAGTRLVAVGFSDSSPSPLEGKGKRQDDRTGDGIRNPPRHVGIDTFSIAGPFDGAGPGDTPIRRRIFSCDPSLGRDETLCVRQILTGLARRAFRRPVTSADIDPLLNLYQEGRRQGDVSAGLERALEALLSSPTFLFRVETEPADTTPGAAYPISGLELASRLSFFLWRSLPDDELMELGVSGLLTEPTVLARQVRRMLADPQAARFMKDFSEQWLEVRNIHNVTPDGNAFPAFNDSLRGAMARETELFFESQVREDRPIPELLLANYSYLNEQLARHYGIEGIYGGHFRRVRLPDERRQGLLGHGSVLTVTSYANRTSVVVRGKWILDTLFAAPPPPAPPNVPALKENDGKSVPASLRERMEQHRRSPVCASCHRQMDPLGFALEHFDGIGQWRDTDDGASIDAAIVWRGQKVDSARAFREALVSDPYEFVYAVAEKLLTFALGRGLEFYDAPTVRQVVRSLERDDYRWSSLILGIVQSQPFRMRRASGSADTRGLSADATLRVREQGDER